MLENRIKLHRNAAKFSQQQLATKAEISLSTLQKAEQGQSIPSVELVAKIAQVLKVRMDDLFVPTPSQICLKPQSEANA